MSLLPEAVLVRAVLAVGLIFFVCVVCSSPVFAVIMLTYVIDIVLLPYRTFRILMGWDKF
jgi:hypothetical protein